MLKFIPFYVSNWNGHIAQVAYIILGDNCVFTACQKAMYGSTINLAEDIAQAIALKEDRSAYSLHFFDIQTSMSFGIDHALRENPGDFQFDEIMFEDGDKGTWWRPTICQDHVIEIFEEFFGGEPNQVFSGGRKKAKRIDFENPADAPIPPIFEYKEPTPGVVKLAEAALAMGAVCFDCGVPLRMENIRYHDHKGGWKVEGMSKRQWLFFECSNDPCRYGTSFSKFGFPGEAEDEQSLSHQQQEGETIN